MTVSDHWILSNMMFIADQSFEFLPV